MGEKKFQPKDQDCFQDDQKAVRVIPVFDDMPLHSNLLRGIYSVGFEKPSAIQQRAIVPLIKGGDVIAQAQSGTGKTGAFSIGLLQRLDFRYPKHTQVLVLSPTRELAQQTCDVIFQLGEFLAENHPNFCQIFIGGTRIPEDIQKLRNGCMVAVGTPGRVEDLMKRNVLRAEMIKLMILDEADEMLSQGFNQQLQSIVQYLKTETQIGLFSATMPEDVLKLADSLLKNPTRILLNKESLTLEGIKQFYVATEEDEKLPTLMDLYESVSIAQSVIFANSRQKVEWIAKKLNENDHTVSYMHADMEKGDREKVMKTFRAGSSRVLVTTDLIARGIDVHHVNIVINYDLPQNLENYLHRIGRGGRYGRKGIAINFVSSRDQALHDQIQAHYQTQIGELPVDFNTYLGE